MEECTEILSVSQQIKKKLFSVKTNYHTAKCFSENVLEMKKKKAKMNKPVYLGLSILEISKTLMYKICYDYMKPSINIIQHYATWIQIAL